MLFEDKTVYGAMKKALGKRPANQHGGSDPGRYEPKPRTLRSKPSSFGKHRIEEDVTLRRRCDDIRIQLRRERDNLNRLANDVRSLVSSLMPYTRDPRHREDRSRLLAFISQLTDIRTSLVRAIMAADNIVGAGSGNSTFTDLLNAMPGRSVISQAMAQSTRINPEINAVENVMAVLRAVRGEAESTAPRIMRIQRDFDRTNCARLSSDGSIQPVTPFGSGHTGSSTHRFQ